MISAKISNKITSFIQFPHGYFINLQDKGYGGFQLF